jgi:uncharacterized protein (TIGR03437 family)
MSFSGTAVGTFGSDSPALQGTGSIAPFGQASLNGSITSFTFTFGAVDTIQAQPLISGKGKTVEIALTITSGTGKFLGVAGSAQLTFNCEGDCFGTKNTVYTSPFTASGSGTLTLPVTVTPVPADAGYPVSGPGGPGYPIAGPGGSGYPFVFCFDGAGGSGSSVLLPTGDCSVLTFDGSGSSGSSVLVFDGSGGSGSSVLVFDGSGSSGSSVLVFEGSGSSGSSVLTFDGSGGSGSSVLVFEGSGGSGSSVYRPCRRCDASSGAASPATGASLEILTPVQSAAAGYTATPQCPASPASCWISVANPSGTIPAASRTAITAIVNPQGLAAGTYTGSVSVAITGNSGPPSILNVPLKTIVTAAAPLLTVSESAVQFQVVSGSTVAQEQFISVSNQGSGTLSFSAAASTLTGGDWLTISPPSGAVVNLQVNASSLPPGQYFGRVDFTAAGAVNSPQSTEVALTVVPASAADPLVSPASLRFTALAGGNPAAQTFQLFNPSTQSLTPSVQASYQQGSNWLTATSSAATVTTASPLSVTVAVNAAGLTPAVYQATLDIHLAETNTDYLVPVTLVVPAASQTSCTPTQLLPVFSSLEGGFQTPAGIPVAVQVQVADDCGSPLTAGAVMAYFPGSSDPSVALAPLGNGQWAGSWLPHNVAGGTATIGVIATSFAPALYGSAGTSGTLSANPSVPVISAGGAVSAASLSAGAPIAPGSYISIFGSNLAAGSNPAGALPYPTTLGGTQVLLGGEPLPLQYTGTGQINAVVPYDASVNSTQELIVQRNGASSLPETVVVAAAQPAVFTQNQSGSGPGAIMVAQANGSQFLDTATTRASAGDALVIYCSGLGAVTLAVAAGAAAPGSPLARTSDPVTVTIGGQAAQVFFAGLTPGYAGLYQVNVYVPSGVAAGTDVPVVVSVAGAASAPVTVAIQ